MPDLDTARRWRRDGERGAAGALQELTDDELRRPSALPGWTRAHVVAHLDRNAGIETAAAVPAGCLRADDRNAETRLADPVAVLPGTPGTRRSATGEAGRWARANPWMRGKEPAQRRLGRGAEGPDRWSVR